MSPIQTELSKETHETPLAAAIPVSEVFLAMLNLKSELTFQIFLGSYLFEKTQLVSQYFIHLMWEEG